MNLSLTLLGFYPGVVHAVGITERDSKFSPAGKTVDLTVH